MSMFRRQTEVSSTSESGSSEYDSTSEEETYESRDGPEGRDEGRGNDHEHLRPPTKTRSAGGMGVPLHRARTIDSLEDSTGNNTNNTNHHHNNNNHESRGSDGTDEVPINRLREDGALSTEILFTTGELSSASAATGAAGDGISTAAHRNMMMAGLLEHYYHSRALEFLVAANPNAAASGRYHRDSPEVRQLGGQLLAQATQRLGASGVLDATAAAEDNAEIRRQYLLGLDSIAVPGVNVETLCSEEGQVAGAVTAMNLGVQGLDIGSTNNLGLPYLPHPANDLQLAVRHHQPPAAAQPPQRSSHYRTSFEEVGFLGKGGFGSVFKCWNRFDDRMYAVKKIPLSPRLSKSFCEGGHDRLGKLLREVRALATFDHANIVRYHATWIEEPSQYSTTNTKGMMPRGTGGLMSGQAIRRGGPQRRQVKLLEHRPMAVAAASSSSAGIEPSFSDGPAPNDISATDDIVFGFDTRSGSEQFSAAEHNLAVGPQWSDNPSSTNRIEELSSSEALDEEEEDDGGDDSDIFTDGDPNAHGAKSIIPTGIPLPDPTVHVLHIQMSLYPMTLAQYLSPSRAPTHCFHLLPSLRLLLSILTGLQYIHSKGLVHRDIKPGNIFLSPSTAGHDDDGSSSDSSHGGYCNVGDCDSCSASSSSTETPTTPVTSAPIWLNPRIGDFGLVTQLAREGLSSPDAALEHSQGGVLSEAEAEMSSEKDEHLVGTMYYRPPRWPQSQPSSPERRRNQQPYPTSPLRGTARRDEKAVGGGGASSSRKRHSMDEKLDIFALGVVLVEMLACCHTAMQRVDMLKAIQEGRVPADDIRRCCALQDEQHRALHKRDGANNGERNEYTISDQVIALAEGMLAPNPDERWDGRRVRTAVEAILADYNSTRTAGRLSQ